MEVSGIIKLIDEVKTYGEKGFRKREVVITTEEQYPQHILIEFTQDNVNLLNTFQVEQKVKININLRGREWTNQSGETKYFNSIIGWRILSMDDEDSAATPPPPIPNTESAPPAMESSSAGSKEEKEEEDDLPF